MEGEEKSNGGCKGSEPDFFLQWGNRKRMRCVRVKDPDISGRIRRNITSRFGNFAVSSSDNENSNPQHSRLLRSSETATLRSLPPDHRRLPSASPEKEERYYTTRGSVMSADENGKISGEGNGNRNGNCNGDERDRGFVWPKLYITLSSKEKEEDFMAMKGCKLPQRPKKRAKIIQRSLLLVSPGAWLTDMCLERYEVREKRSSKKRARGLKAMGNLESDSE